MGCGFCATARAWGWCATCGRRRSWARCVPAQALAAPERLTNVVLMGMGEPLANYDAVVAALEILTAEWGYAISPRRITVSTVGLAPAIPRFIAETRVNLAVSLHAPTDRQRERLVPVNRRYPLAALLAACREVPLPRRKRITFEYVMLAGENDADADARALVRLLHGLRAKVNLIPWNPFPGRRPSSRARARGSCASRPCCASTACRRPSARAAGRTSRRRAASSPWRGPPPRVAMPGIGVIINPNASGNRNGAGARERRMADVVGAFGWVRVTPTIDAIDDVAREFHDRGIDILAICGGDGSDHCTLTAFHRIWASRQAAAAPAAARRHHQLRRRCHRRPARHTGAGAGARGARLPARQHARHDRARRAARQRRRRWASC